MEGVSIDFRRIHMHNNAFLTGTDSFERLNPKAPLNTPLIVMFDEQTWVTL